MLDAAREAMGFAEGHDRVDLDYNRMLTFAIVRAVEIIGEAANKISPDLKAAHPNVPWQNIVGMRNRLIHGYFDIDLDRVWDTVTLDLPALVLVLEQILPDNLA